MALKLTTSQDVEITVTGTYGKYVRIKAGEVDIEVQLNEKEIDELVYMLKGY